MIRFGTRVVFCAAVLCFPVNAQTQPATPPGIASQASPVPDATTVVVMGQKTRRDRAAVRITTQSSSSCGFARGYSAYDDQIVQDYMDSFHDGDNSSNREPGADETDPTSPNSQIRDTSPFGNASQDQSNLTTDSEGTPTTTANGRFTAEQPGGCTSADIAFAAGRNFILRKDHSLKDAYTAFDAGEYEKALGLFETAYKKIGYEQAAFMAGKMYLSGLGAPRNTAKAIYWLKQVAEAKFTPGDEQTFDPADPYYMSTRSDATMTLAKIYMVGWDVARDPKEARKWYVKADTIGYVPAGYVLGQIYQKGYAGDKNGAKAISLFQKAGHLGFTPAQYELGLIYYNGEDGVTEDRKVAAQWLMAAASGGHPDALFAVARMYDQGDTLPQDTTKALAYYRDAALKGQAAAQTALGTYFYTGEAVGKDWVVARKWFIEAAKSGEPDGMFNLAVMLSRGEGGEKDVMLAYVWFRLASMSGLEKATQAATKIEPELTPDDRAKANAILNPSMPH
ncbi:SEL1-like repeat protein [Asticcacaulis sp. 201]|uniref:SEL1-like repeat protein n=1 Tax=Asticcacaulis sp. 201 TaxID=3028787 RepID=UPI00291648AB|nr:SEL1-like repeat protein [Asticcacaulis sp. 201]MDV6329268.1 SEL1-like repeat protein [Asticcacaulis sp. 201]